MEKLLQRAKHQRVINTLDFKRLTANSDAETLLGIVTVIDKINNISVASLFSNDESILDRAELQGGMNGKDYGSLSNEDRANLTVRGIKLDDTLETVGTPLPPMITRAEFGKMNVAQKQDVIKTKQLVDELPEPDLTRPELHEISLRIAQQTKEVLDDSGLLIKKDNEDDTD